MSQLGELSDLTPLTDKLTSKIKTCTSVEGAAQAVTDTLYEEFRESIVLTRFFATVPFGRLPASNADFVSGVARSQNVSHLLKRDTPVLSLLGTRGVEPDWDDRRTSRGHVGIPLISAGFIETIPMIARLLQEVGLQVNWIDRQAAISIKTFVGASGVFYVQDAASALDDQGRKIIAAQDFVQTYQVKTVFGLAGNYAVHMSFLTLILFCRETLEKRQAEKFLFLMSHIKSSMGGLVASEVVFA